MLLCQFQLPATSDPLMCLERELLLVELGDLERGSLLPGGGWHAPCSSQQEQQEERKAGQRATACNPLWSGVAHLCELPVGHQVGSIQEAILSDPAQKGSPPGRRPQQQTGPLGLELRDSWPRLCQRGVHLSQRPSTIHSQDPMGGPVSGSLPQGWPVLAK